MKYIVWVREDGRWQEQGEGPMTKRQAERIAREIRKYCGVSAKALPLGMEPS